MILLTAINAKYIHSNLAIYCLKAYTDKYEEQIQIAEYTINQNQNDILCDIYEKKPEVIAFSCYIWNIRMVIDIARTVKKVLPDTLILAGGPEVSYQPKQILESYLSIDIVIIGEGEKPFLSYLEWQLEGNGSLSHIRGIAYRKKETVMINEPCEIMNLDEVVFPYKGLKDMEHRVLYYETSRGCPFSCSYCLSSIDKAVRFRSLNKVYAELDFFLENKVSQVKFIDRTFNCNHNHAYAIWDYIGKKDNQITSFHFEIAADLLKKEDFALFTSFRPGLIQLEVGIQSTNEQTIKAVHRQMDLEKVKYSVEQVHKNSNIHQHLDLIAGLPFEDIESFCHSFNDVYAMKPDQLQLGFLKALRGSLMRDSADEYQLIYNDNPPYEVLGTKWLSYADVLYLKRVEEMVEVYYNSFQFCASVKFLLAYHKTPFDFFASLGQYYKENDFEGRALNRLNRYTILQSYFESKVYDANYRRGFMEALTYDYYLRENAKTPPPFANEQSNSERQYIRKFFINEANEWKYLPGYKGCTSKQLESMTKLKKFHFDVEYLMETGKCKRKTNYILFDYRQRNPLNHSANVIYMNGGLE